MELVDLLSEFFVSPDIANIFQTMLLTSDMSRDDFLELNNSLETRKFHPCEIEAFLIWCNKSRFLFQYSPETGIVSFSHNMRGWEFVHEMPNSGPARQAVYTEPRHAPTAEERLKQSQSKFGLDAIDFAARLITEPRLIVIIANVLLPDVTLEDEEIKEIIRFWHGVGLFFM